MNRSSLQNLFIGITSVIALIFACQSSFLLINREKNNEKVFTEFGNYQPKLFIVDESYDGLIKNQGNRGMSAAFSFISYAESIYRHFLFANKEINKNQTVEFSVQAFSSYLLKICNENSKYSKICEKLKVGERFSLEELSMPILLEIIENIPEMKNSLFPVHTCPYKDEYDNYECNDTLSDNPLSFSVSSIMTATGVDAIKEMIYNTSKPVLLTMPSLNADYYIPCTDERVMGNEECKEGQQSVSCPYDTSRKCGILTFPAKTMAGDYYLPLKPVEISVGYPMNFEVVGYADSFVVSRGNANLDYVKVSKGGFIIKGTTNMEGNPITYYAGNLDRCQNDYASQYWYGPLLSCMLKYNNINNCSSKTIDDDDSETRFKEADLLKCIDENYCEKGKYYMVAHQPVRTFETVVYEEESGMTLTKLIQYRKSGSFEVKINQIPFYRLGTIFTPNDFYLNEYNCGYGFLPYDVVNKAMEISKDLGSHVLAMSIDMDFPKSSLPSKMKHNKYTSMFKEFSSLTERKINNYGLP